MSILLRLIFVFVAGVSVWVFAGKALAGFFFPELVASIYAAQVPWVMFTGFCVGLVTLGATLLAFGDSL